MAEKSLKDEIASLIHSYERERNEALKQVIINEVKRDLANEFIYTLKDILDYMDGENHEKP